MLEIITVQLVVNRSHIRVVTDLHRMAENHFVRRYIYRSVGQFIYGVFANELTDFISYPNNK